LGYADFLHVRVKAQHEVRRKMMLKDRQTTSPSAFCRMKDASSRGVEEHPFIDMGDSSYMGYRVLACLLQPRLGILGHYRPPDMPFQSYVLTAVKSLTDAHRCQLHVTYG
jgi:hypothetical protein